MDIWIMAAPRVADGAATRMLAEQIGLENTTMSVGAEIRRLQDRFDIYELLAGYCRRADLLDPPGMASLFTDNCIVSYVPPHVAPTITGKAALLEMLLGYLPQTVSSSHHITNIELLFDTPDTVTGHAYLYSWERFQNAPATADCHRWGRYEFRLQRTEQGWRFSRLTLLSAGELGSTRIAEQFGRQWPPRFD
jgi:hypothetical protein